MPAQSLVYVMTRASPCLLPRAPCQSSIIPCKCCQRSVWYKLGIMAIRLQKLKERRRKEENRKSKTPRTWVCAVNPRSPPGVRETKYYTNTARRSYRDAVENHAE